jgi:hypothetical protein
MDREARAYIELLFEEEQKRCRPGQSSDLLDAPPNGISQRLFRGATWQQMRIDILSFMRGRAPYLFTIGVTDDLTSRMKDHGIPRVVWSERAASEAHARLIKRWGLGIGMQGGTGGQGQASYVYVFRRESTLLERIVRSC